DGVLGGRLLLRRVGRHGEGGEDEQGRHRGGQPQGVRGSHGVLSDSLLKGVDGAGRGGCYLAGELARRLGDQHVLPPVILRGQVDEGQPPRPGRGGGAAGAAGRRVPVQAVVQFGVEGGAVRRLVQQQVGAARQQGDVGAAGGIAGEGDGPAAGRGAQPRHWR